MKKISYWILISVFIFIVSGSAELKAEIVGTPDHEYTTIGGENEEKPQPPQPSQPSQPQPEPQTPDNSTGTGSGGKNTWQRESKKDVSKNDDREKKISTDETENTVSANSVSENSVSENTVSANSVSENTVSENRIPERTESKKDSKPKVAEKKEVKKPMPDPEPEPEPAKHIGLTILAAYLIVILSLVTIYVFLFATHIYYKESGSGDYKWFGIVFPRKDGDGYTVRIRKSKKSDNYKISFKMKFANKHYGEPLSITAADAETQSSISKDVIFDLF